ncbi:MAG: PDZ domain-containing protein [Phycisphaerae bacterium]|nr:PDZ domain-containing protein [Phycisphaerae bacterium]
MHARNGLLREGWAALLGVFLTAVAGCGGSVYLGLQVEDATSLNRTAVLITEVEPNTPTGDAGIEPNDIIVSFNLSGVMTVDALRKDEAALNLGSAVTLRVFRPRTGNVLTADIELTADPNSVPTSLGIHVMNSTSPDGVAIVSVETDSAADEAGMLANDVITKFGSTAVSTVDQLRRALANTTVNSTVTVTYRRGGPDATDATTDVVMRYDVVSRLPVMGISAQDLSAQLADRLGYPALNGVLVTAALIGGPAFDAGIMPRDVIFLYNGQDINEVSDLVSAVRAFGGSGTVAVGHSRGGDLFVTDVPLRGSVSGNNYTLDVGLALVETFGGLLVVEVGSGSSAATATIQVDDLITAVEGQATLTPQEFFRQIDAALDIVPRITGVSVTTIRNNVTVTRFLQIRTTTDSGTDTTGGTSTTKASTTKTIPYEL